MESTRRVAPQVQLHTMPRSFYIATRVRRSSPSRKSRGRFNGHTYEYMIARNTHAYTTPHQHREPICPSHAPPRPTPLIPTLSCLESSSWTTTFRRGKKHANRLPQSFSCLGCERRCPAASGAERKNVGGGRGLASSMCLRMRPLATLSWSL